MRSHGHASPTERLGRAARAQRKTLGVTQKELALIAGCGPDFLYDMERGKPTLRLDKVIEVLSVLGLELLVRRGKGRVVVSPEVELGATRRGRQT